MGIYKWIVDRFGEPIDVSTIAEHERVVLCVWNASGIIDNGGFNYLFEGSFDGDPQYLLTLEAFQAIGSGDAVVAFRRVFKLFPEGRPPTEIGARLQQYRRGGAAPRQEIDRLFWKASKDIHRPLAAYVRLHEDLFLKTNAFGNPLSAAPTEPAPAPLKEHFSAPAKTRTVPDRVANLPHWARVALAARCAAMVLPEFQRSWPNALPARLETVKRCIAGAEQSALHGRAVEMAPSMTSGGLIVVGAALMGLRGSSFKGDDEPYPVDGNLAVVASQAARVALKAAEAAENGPEHSADYASEAVSDALDIARAVESETIGRRIARILAELERAAAAQDWDDDSSVSRAVFSSLSKAHRSWWRFW